MAYILPASSTCPRTFQTVPLTCLLSSSHGCCVRISSEHSPKLQIRSHSYLRAVSEVSINRSLDTLDPKTLLDPKSLLSSPQYRSRNESYMRAMSTISQVGAASVSTPSLVRPGSNTLLSHPSTARSVEMLQGLWGPGFHLIPSEENPVHPKYLTARWCLPQACL